MRTTKISRPPAVVGVRTYAMDGGYTVHTTCMHAWFHVAKDCAVQLAEGEDR